MPKIVLQQHQHLLHLLQMGWTGLGRAVQMASVTPFVVKTLCGSLCTSGDAFGQDHRFERYWRRTLSQPSRARCPPSQHSNCTSSNSDQIYQPINFLSLSKCVEIILVGGQPLRCLLISDILNKDELGVTQKNLGIKTIILGTIMATKASATFIICQVLPSTPLIRPAIATLAELAGRMAAVCQHHYT